MFITTGGDRPVLFDLTHISIRKPHCLPIFCNGPTRNTDALLFQQFRQHLITVGLFLVSIILLLANSCICAKIKAGVLSFSQKSLKPILIGRKEMIQAPLIEDHWIIRVLNVY